MRPGFRRRCRASGEIIGGAEATKFLFAAECLPDNLPTGIKLTLNGVMDLFV